MSLQRLLVGCFSTFFSFALVFAFAIPARAQNAASIYSARCAVCHGSDGKGDTAVGKKIGVRDFASPEVKKETDKELIEITAKGKNKMPGYEKTLTEAQISGLVAYIRNLANKQ